MNTPRILFVSSADPLSGPGAIGLNHFNQLREAGLNVDMLTLMKVPSHPEIMYVKERTKWTRIKEYFIWRYKELLGIKDKDTVHLPYCFFYEKENRPPVPIKQVLKPLKNKQYDLVIIFFWLKMLSYETVEAIYNKFHSVMFFLSPDFCFMSGGCHFPGDCKGYITGCGCCPAIGSTDKNDFTHWNVNYRKQVLKRIKPVVFCNSYMLSFFESSLLLKDVKKIKSWPVVDSKSFYPIEKDILRKKYEIPVQKEFIIGFGCQRLSDSRKGMSVLMKAFSVLFKSLNETERDKVYIIAAGGEFDSLKEKIPFDSKGLGMLPFTQLPEFYSLSNIFVCPSLNDAGPSMVGQSIACGTPVVGFEMGALLDLVKGHGTGICVEVGNATLLAQAMADFIRMSNEEYTSYTDRCLRLVSDLTSDKKIQQWMDVYKEERKKIERNGKDN